MGIFKRLTELVRANVNDIIDKAQDPEKMLNQLMFELREEKRKAHLQVVRCIADEKRLEQQVREHQDKLSQWQKRAEVAVLRDEDDLAREAISRRNEYATMVDTLTRQWEEQHEMAEQLKDALSQLERRYKEAEFRKQHMINQYHAVQANKKASETMAKMANTGHIEEFAKVEQKIQEMGALASANTEMQEMTLEDRFSHLESEGVVEHDLVRLKLQMGKVVPELPASNGTSQAALPGARSNGAAGTPASENLEPAESPQPSAARASDRAEKQESSSFD